MEPHFEKKPIFQGQDPRLSPRVQHKRAPVTAAHMLLKAVPRVLRTSTVYKPLARGHDAEH